MLYLNADPPRPGAVVTIPVTLPNLITVGRLMLVPAIIWFISEQHFVAAFFVFVILGVTTAHAPTGFAPLAIGLTLTLIHLISIPIDNTSVNPARSLGVAFFNGNGAPGQVWAFIVAPIVGAVIAGWSFEAITGIDRSNLDVGGAVNPGEVMTEPALPAAAEAERP